LLPFKGKLEQALSCFDTQGQGWVPVAQLQYVLTNYGERMSAQEFQAFQQDAGAQQQQINVRAAAARFTFK
jgi:Ca2+-binding EF-hand superfamily protein